MSIKQPQFLKITDAGVVVTLTRPCEFNGVAQDTLTMREPTVQDVRTANKTAEYDEEQRELNLFATLAQVGVHELEKLHVKDYNRIQRGYKFLVHDDAV